MKPTVGRIVHFHGKISSPMGGTGPFAAIVTAVSSDDVVTLSVFVPPTTFVMPFRDVKSSNMPLKAGEPYWCWPPRE